MPAGLVVAAVPAIAVVGAVEVAVSVTNAAVLPGGVAINEVGVAVDPDPGGSSPASTNPYWCRISPPKYTLRI